ncbi:MAG: nucleotidyltransferase family protein [Geminicoccaceae bacterium]
MTPELHPSIPWLAERLGAFPEVRRVILFGSRARGDNDERADIDIAVEADAERLGVWWELVDEAPTLLAVDLIIMTDVPPAMRETIEREGILLYERKSDQASA